VLVPARNEAAVIAGTVRSILASDHPDLEVIVIDDGSEDTTAALAAAVDPRVRVLRRDESPGKANALRAGLDAATGEVIVTVDADTVLAPDAVRWLSLAIAHGDDAVAAHLEVGNRAGWLGQWQNLEYVTGLHLGRRAQAAVGAITTLPGAASAFRASALQAVGGHPGRTFVEDTDVTLLLLRAGFRVGFEPRARAWTEAPTTWRGLLAQRARWLHGYWQILWVHRGAFLGLDALALIGMPNLLYANLVGFLLLPPAVFTALTSDDAGTAAWAVDIVLGGLVIDLLACAAAWRLGGQDWRELRHAPLQRLVWPWFLAVVFGATLLRVLTRSRAWSRVVRDGALARAASAGRVGAVAR
jgi:cellulose synthase/poly-beta-1,6-N-acetylglucosamine synthase-like glycosyltransferase